MIALETRFLEPPVSSRRASPLPLMERHGGGTTAARCAARRGERWAVVAVASSVLPAPRQDGMRTGGSGREWLSRATISSCSCSFLSAIDGATQGDELSGAAAYAAICSHNSIEMGWGTREASVFSGCIHQEGGATAVRGLDWLCDSIPYCGST